MVHKGTKTLEINRLLLRPFVLADAEAMFKNWANDSEVTKYLMWKPHGTIEVTKEVLDDWIKRYKEQNFYQWAIVEKSINEPIGSISVVKQDDKIKMVHIGYCIGKSWWGKGYTSEALKRLVKFFFEEVEVNRIEARHDPRNTNSGKVMQKAGLRYEGTSLQSDFSNQGISDMANYALIAKDYFINSPVALSATPISRSATKEDIETVTSLLLQLYHMSREELFDENVQHFSDCNSKQHFFLSFINDIPIGVAHVSLRSEYVNGTELEGTCGYLEAIYVVPEYRGNGVATALVNACENWAKEQGCKEFASDCLLHNSDSYLFHLRIGFTETERCVFFRKDIK